MSTPNITSQRPFYTYDGIEDAQRQQLALTDSCVWAAPWDASIIRSCVVTIVGGGGAGGSGGAGGEKTRYPGHGGQEGGETFFGEESAQGGGGGAGGSHGAGGAGGGAGLVRRLRLNIRGGSQYKVSIGLGGVPGDKTHATTYAQQKGGGVLGGRPMGNEDLYDRSALGSSEGGDGGGAGRDGYPGYVSWQQGSRGGRNGTGFGGGGGGGAYCYSAWGEDKGGLGYDGGQNGTAIIGIPNDEHNVGGKGGDGAVLIEWDQEAQCDPVIRQCPCSLRHAAMNTMIGFNLCGCSRHG